jgi:CTP synthase (UTP-ammonia lyase)
MLLSLKLEGDIESLPYIESVRQLVWDMGEKNVFI